MGAIKIKRKYDHYEIYLGDHFIATADTYSEAVEEAEEFLENFKK